MPVWKTAMSIAVQVFQLSHYLPKAEDYGLTSQIRRSANSVSANISEAFGRLGNKDKVKFYIIARASAFETQSHLIYGAQIGYFNEKTTQEIIIEYNQLIFELNKIIKTLSPP